MALEGRVGAAVAAVALLACWFLPFGSAGQAATMPQQEALRQHFGAELPVQLANHPAPPVQGFLAQALFVVQLAVLAVVLAGRQAAPHLQRLGIVLPEAYWQTMQEKKTAILLGTWFLGNTVRQNLLSTGAFEVSYEGLPIWSKLETHRMPTLGDLVDGISQAMRAASGDGAAAQ